ncbi:MAG: A/G-specific adenine glycosylase [Candidatus Paceibacterota bacterium]
MLQQTQVERVIPLYKKFIKEFPTVKKLAQAPLSEVLKSWQGLGYNRRAKLLRGAAQHLVSTPSFRTRFNLVTELEKLPGVGPYTARAIAAFVWNQDVIVIETNIRTAIIHHFFARQTVQHRVSDKEIEKILLQVLPKGKAPLRQSSAGQAREWYSALMDYGAYLKKSGIKLNAKHANYTKQKKFVGSSREARGAILRELASSSYTQTHLLNLLGPTRHSQLCIAIIALQSEGLIQKKKGVFSLAN